MLLCFNSVSQPITQKRLVTSEYIHYQDHAPISTQQQNQLRKCTYITWSLALIPFPTNDL